MRRARGRVALVPWWVWVIGILLLFLGLLFKTRAAGRQSPTPWPVVASDEAANGKSEGPVVQVPSAMASPGAPAQQLNQSGSQGAHPSILKVALQTILFVLSGCCGLAVLFFLARAFSFEVVANNRMYGLMNNSNPLDTISVSSDEETAFMQDK